MHRPWPNILSKKSSATQKTILKLKFKAPKNSRQALPPNGRKNGRGNETGFPSPLERSRTFPETEPKLRQKFPALAPKSVTN